MEPDYDLAEKMQALARKRADVAREEEEIRHLAQLTFGQLDRKIEELEAGLADLLEERQNLADFLGLTVQSSSERLAHGALKELCFEALEQSADGMRSAEVKEWITKNHPDIKVSSVPATLSRQMEQGALKKDQFGRYSLQRR